MKALTLFIIIPKLCPEHQGKDTLQFTLNYLVQFSEMRADYSNPLFQYYIFLFIPLIQVEMSSLYVTATGTYLHLKTMNKNIKIIKGYMLENWLHKIHWWGMKEYHISCHITRTSI